MQRSPLPPKVDHMLSPGGGVFPPQGKASGPGAGLATAAILAKLVGLAYATSPWLRDETKQLFSAGVRALGNPLSGSGQ